MCLLYCLPCTNKVKNCGWLPYCPYSKPSDQKRQRNSRWMRALSFANPNLLLRDAVVPSSHDSGSYSISKNKIWAGLAIAQEYSVYQQLQSGVRLLDIRYQFSGKGDQDCRISHGGCKGTSIQDVLQQIRRFISEEPGEFLVMSIINEIVQKSPTSSQINYLVQQIRSLFADVAINAADMASWFNIERVTLGQIQASGKKIFIIAGSSLSHNYREESLDFLTTSPEQAIIFYRDHFWSSFWYDLDNPQALLKKVPENVKLNETNRSIIVVSQFNLTNQYDIESIINLITGKVPYRIDQLVGLLLKKKLLLYFLRDNASLKWNYMWFDFFNFHYQAIEFLIGLNFSNLPLTIDSAWIDESIDVTEQCRELVKKGRGCCLYIVDFRKDFGLEKSRGNLELSYHFAGDLGKSYAKFNFALGWNESQFVLNYCNRA